MLELVILGCPTGKVNSELELFKLGSLDCKLLSNVNPHSVIFFSLLGVYLLRQVSQARTKTAAGQTIFKEGAGGKKGESVETKVGQLFAPAIPRVSCWRPYSLSLLQLYW